MRTKQELEEAIGVPHIGTPPLVHRELLPKRRVLQHQPVGLLQALRWFGETR